VNSLDDGWVNLQVSWTFSCNLKSLNAFIMFLLSGQDGVQSIGSSVMLKSPIMKWGWSTFFSCHALTMMFQNSGCCSRLLGAYMFRIIRGSLLHHLI